MLQKTLHHKLVLFGGVICVVLLTALSMPTAVRADDPVPAPDNGNCIVCHENLYFLHDTGNWFCLKESPMACTNCHGGDPNTLNKDVAHANRAAHPVINDDVSKCRQCHPEECSDRVAIFDQSAGISNVLVAAPYTPSYFADAVPAWESAEDSGSLLPIWEVIPLLLVAGLALGIHLVLHRRHKSL